MRYGSKPEGKTEGESFHLMRRPIVRRLPISAANRLSPKSELTSGISLYIIKASNEAEDNSCLKNAMAGAERVDFHEGLSKRLAESSF